MLPSCTNPAGTGPSTAPAPPPPPLPPLFASTASPGPSPSCSCGRKPFAKGEAQLLRCGSRNLHKAPKAVSGAWVMEYTPFSPPPPLRAHPHHAKVGVGVTAGATTTGRSTAPASGTAGGGAVAAAQHRSHPASCIVLVLKGCAAHGVARQRRRGAAQVAAYGQQRIQQLLEGRAVGGTAGGETKLAGATRSWSRGPCVCVCVHGCAASQWASGLQSTPMLPSNCA